MRIRHLLHRRRRISGPPAKQVFPAVKISGPSGPVGPLDEWRRLWAEHEMQTADAIFDQLRSPWRTAAVNAASHELLLDKIAKKETP